MTDLVMTCSNHGELAQEHIIKGGFQSGKQRYRCRLCARSRYDKFYKNNRERVLQIQDEWRKNNVEKVKHSKRLSLIKNREKYRKRKQEEQRRYVARHPDCKKKYNKNKVKKVYDAYVVDILCKDSNLKSRDIPKSLIDLKRNQILLKRAIKERENA